MLQQPQAGRRATLTLCAVLLLFVAWLANARVLARYEEHRLLYQESPLSPLETPVTSAVPSTIVSPLTTTLTVDVTPTITEETVVILPATSTVAVVEAPAPTAELVNRGQTSLLLVGAVLAGALIVTVLVIGRER
jgi:hypothetical protein